MNLQLAGKKALITGGFSGISKAVARQLSQEGVDCLICSNDEAALKETARELIRFTGSNLSPVPGSKVIPVVADLSDSDSILSLVEKAAELLGGIDILVNSGEPKDSYSRCVDAVSPYMKENNWGRIINVSSLDAQDVNNMTESSSVELGQYGITVNTVDWGVKEPETTNTEDIANVITFLASPLSVAIAGEVIDVSGEASRTIQYQNNR